MKDVGIGPTEAPKSVGVSTARCSPRRWAGWKLVVLFHKVILHPGATKRMLLNE